MNHVLTKVEIRKAHPDEIQKVIEFISPFVEQGKLLPRTVDEMDEWVDNLFIAEYEGAIVGCAALEIYSRKLAELRSLAVAPEFQGSGIGKLLVNACVELAREHNILEVMAITNSESFFRACGFDVTLTGEKKALFYQTRTEPEGK